MRKPTTSEWIVVKNSKIHHRGVFAKKDIPIGTKIIEYVGEKITKAESDKRADTLLEKYKKAGPHGNVGGVYMFTLNKRYDIDGNVPWNTAGLINHSCNPNAESDVIKGRIYIIAFKKIKKGEEITYNYGYDLENWEDHPCQCGSTKCVGYIVDEEDWPKLKKKIKKKKEKLKLAAKKAKEKARKAVKTKK